MFCNGSSNWSKFFKRICNGYFLLVRFATDFLTGLTRAKENNSHQLKTMLREKNLGQGYVKSKVNLVSLACEDAWRKTLGNLLCLKENEIVRYRPRNTSLFSED